MDQAGSSHANDARTPTAQMIILHQVGNIFCMGIEIDPTRAEWNERNGGDRIQSI